MIEFSAAFSVVVGILLLVFLFFFTRASKKTQKSPMDPSWYLPDPVTTLSKHEVQLLQESWAKVVVDPKEAGLLIFKNYFIDYPDAVQLFKDFKGKSIEQIMKMGQMRAHAVTVVRALSSVIENLDDAEVVVDILHKQGYNHFSKNVTSQDFLNLNISIMRTFKMALGDAFDAELEKTWSKTLGVVASVCKGGLEEAQAEAVADGD